LGDLGVDEGIIFSARNAILEALAYFLKANQGYTVRKWKQDK
jgi:hypothetical protein